VQASAYTQKLTRDGVDYYFLPFGGGAPRGHTNEAFVRLLRNLGPDVLHIHGLGFPRDVETLAAHIPEVPIVLQDHASVPPRLWKRARWRRGFRAAAGIAFCSRLQARPFEKARLVHPAMRIYEIPESTSRFTPASQDEARRITGLRGDPIVLWVGHLNGNKDPLTVLHAVSAAARSLPHLQLYCCFGDAPLLPAVRDCISADPLLRGRVHLLGRVLHEKVEQLMRAADIFVLGSHREGSGYSLLEALACGLPPVVTEIPSFRALTGAGAVGKLWSCGDFQQCAAALLSVAACGREPLRRRVREHFDRELSFHAVGGKLVSMYESVWKQ
jgi:glycosyltransferase involved in cell wall biosynthesis